MIEYAATLTALVSEFEIATAPPRRAADRLGIVAIWVAVVGLTVASTAILIWLRQRGRR